MGGHVVYVKKEEEGAKDSALWDSRAHVYLTRLAVHPSTSTSCVLLVRKFVIQRWVLALIP